MQIAGITFLDRRTQSPINSHSFEKHIGTSTVIIIVKMKNNQSETKNKPIFRYIFISIM